MLTKLSISFRGILTCEQKIRLTEVLYTHNLVYQIVMNTQTLLNVHLSRKTDTSLVQPSNQVNAALDKHLHTMASKGTVKKSLNCIVYHFWPLYSWPGIFFCICTWGVTVAQCNYSCCSLTCLLKNTWGDLKGRNTVQLSLWPQSCTYTSQQRSESLVWGESGVVGT